LAVLKKIAEKLAEINDRQLTVSCAIYFHRITDFRLTGSTRSNIKVFECICGPRFLSISRAAVVTTMWDRLDNNDRDRYDSLHTRLVQRLSHLTGSDLFFKFFNDSNSAKLVLDRFAAISKKKLGIALGLQVEVKSGSSASRVRNTVAGKVIVSQMNSRMCTIL
jgi:hypothetical protein